MINALKKSTATKPVDEIESGILSWSWNGWKEAYNDGSVHLFLDGFAAPDPGLNLGTIINASKITQGKLSIYISVKDLDSSTLCVDPLPSRCGTRERENSFLQRTILAPAQSIIRILTLDSVSRLVSVASLLHRK